MKPRPPKRPGQAPFRVNADDPGPDRDLDMRRPVDRSGMGRVAVWALAWSAAVIGIGLLLYTAP